MKRFNAKKLSIHKGYLRFERKYCHRIIWEQDVGQIPDGYDVHHKDGNKLNNLLENLECLSKSDHIRLHANANREKMRKCMSENSDKVHAWLKTDKGKKFLSEKAKKQWKNRPLKTFNCEHCKKDFQTKHNRLVKFCGDACVMKSRNASGVDNEERVCVICSKTFIINRYQKTKTCSFVCRNKLISKLKLK